MRCLRIRSTASSIRSSGVVSEMRKKPSPLGPYIEPGETTTAASSRTVSAKEVEVWPLGDRGPDVDRALRRGDVDADRAERRDDEVAAAGVGRVHLGERLRRARERGGAGDLDRLEEARVDVGLEPPVGLDRVRVAEDRGDSASRSCCSPWRARRPRPRPPWRPASPGSSARRSRRRSSPSRRCRGRRGSRARGRSRRPPRRSRRGRSRRSGCWGS